MFKEEILSIVSAWSIEQLDDYIGQLEKRIMDTHALLKELRLIKRRKQGRKNYDTGQRGG